MSIPPADRNREEALQQQIEFAMQTVPDDVAANVEWVRARQAEINKSVDDAKKRIARGLRVPERRFRI